MDFSGIGMLLVSGCGMIFVPPILAFGAYAAILKIEGQEQKLNERKVSPLFIMLYVLSLIATCFILYFFYLRFMYVM